MSGIRSQGKAELLAPENGPAKDISAPRRRPDGRCPLGPDHFEGINSIVKLERKVNTLVNYQGPNIDILARGKRSYLLCSGFSILSRCNAGQLWTRSIIAITLGLGL
jgi:hypothetical protein